MAANIRNALQIERDRREIASLYLQGWQQAEIAEKLSQPETGRGYALSQQMVSYDIQQLIKQWRESALIDLDETKAQELARINELERTYWRAWLESCKDAETVKQKGQPSDVPGRVHTEQIERTTKGQAGDPSFLRGVQWCIEMRCKIFGVYAASKIEHSGTGEGGAIPIITEVVVRMPGDDGADDAVDDE